MPRRSLYGHLSPFRRHILSWMSRIQLHLSAIRNVFLLRYEALLLLRQVDRHLLGPRQAAMEVLLNLRAFPRRQHAYLQAIIRNVNAMIAANIEHESGLAIRCRQEALWEVPGPMPQNPQARLAWVALDEDLPAPLALIEFEDYVREE
jgi:hypothetical protein